MLTPRRIVMSVLWSVIVCGIAVAEELPRYSLPVGRQLTYTVSSESKSTDGGNNDMGTSGTWQLTVVRENPDGSRRVVVRSATSFTQSIGGQKHSQPERVTLAYADIFPDGRVVPNPSLGMKMDMGQTVPVLPKDDAEAAKGWSKENPMRMETTSYSAQPAADGEFVFTAIQDGVMNKIYATTSKSTYHFDPKRGIITSSENEQSQDYGFHSKGTGTLKLDSDQTIAPDQAAQLAADFELLFAAKDEYQTKMSGVDKDPSRADALIGEAKSALEKARDGVKSESARGELEKMIKDHDDYAKHARDGADRFKEVLNKPSPDWETTDIDGKPAKLADYRGKVVVMDFWYRGCGWCMYAMPQVKQLADDFSDKPVVVLGMNTDREEKDARMVIDTLGLKYPTIKAEGIPPKYGVQGFPTLIILDQEGVVRDVHVGYSPTLHDDVAKKVKELLDKPAKPAA